MAIFEPPPGWVDMLDDAGDAPPLPEARPMDVPGLGVVQVRKPKPRSIAVLAATQNELLSPAERSDMTNLFVQQHLGEGEYARIIAGMIDGAFPAQGTVGSLTRAITTNGTARPYLAIVNLAVTCAESWRRIQPRINRYGIRDPMLLPTMGALLNLTEDIILECMVTGDKTKDDAARDGFYNRLYAPILMDGETVGPPPGWSEEETDDSFDAFAAAWR